MKNYLITLLIMTTCWQAQLYTMYMQTSHYDDAARTRHRLAMMFVGNIVKEGTSLSQSRHSTPPMSRLIFDLGREMEELRQESKWALKKMERDIETSFYNSPQQKAERELQKLRHQSLAAQKQIQVDKQIAKQSAKEQQKRYKNQQRSNNYAVKNRR